MVHCPYASCVQRYDRCPQYRRTQTQGRIENGLRPFTREDMLEAVRLLDASESSGNAGRKARNPGAMSLQARIDRGLFILSGPKWDGKGADRVSLRELEHHTGTFFQGGKPLARGSILAPPSSTRPPPLHHPAPLALRRATTVMPPPPRALPLLAPALPRRPR